MFTKELGGALLRGHLKGAKRYPNLTSRSPSYRIRIHSRSTLGSAFSALWRASAFVTRWPFPHRPLVGSGPVLSGRA